jgi:cytochrome c5
MWFLVTIATAAAAFALGQDASLPAGEGKAILEGKCTTCHDLSSVTGQHADAEAWKGVVQSMKDMGADVSDEETKVLVDYLVKNFGPAAATSSPGNSAAGKKILEDSCIGCHGMDEIEKQSLSKEDWQTMVKMMIDYGAALKDSDIPVLVDYLAATYPKK